MITLSVFVVKVNKPVRLSYRMLTKQIREHIFSVCVYNTMEIPVVLIWIN